METEKTTARALRVLVIDDEHDNNAILEAMLAHRGHEVRCATSSHEAFYLMASFQPHLVICDVLMPKQDGFEFLKRLKTIPAFENTPVIFLSACYEPWVMKRGFALGATDYLTKPFDWREIFQSIDRVLSPYKLC